MLNLSCFDPGNNTPLNIYLSELDFLKEWLSSMAFRLTEVALYYSELAKIILIFQYLQGLFSPTKQ